MRKERLAASSAHSGERCSTHPGVPEICGTRQSTTSGYGVGGESGSSNLRSVARARAALGKVEERAPPSETQGDHRLRCGRSEEHTSELQSPCNLVCRLLLEKKKKKKINKTKIK